jgi:starch synthase
MSAGEVLLAHPGTQYSFQLARELFRINRLSEFHTSLAFNGDSKITVAMSLILSKLGKEKVWQNLFICGVPSKRLRSYPSLEWSAYLQGSRGHTLSALRKRNDNFQRRIPDSAFQKAKAVVGFDTSSNILCERTSASGKPFILDRSIAYQRGDCGLLESLREQFPAWTQTSERKSAHDLEIEDHEHDLARLIVVPSRFAADTLIASGVSSDKICINPFGTDLQKFYSIRKRAADARRVIFLFVGALQARKGVPLLLKAWQTAKPCSAELWIAGPGEVPEEARKGLPDSVKWLGPISREKLPVLFQQADVFVFPSFFEGLAQVQVEAAACGLPIIGTTNSGATEIVEDGATGFIVSAGDLDQLVERIEAFIVRPGLVIEMSERVKSRREALSWSKYGDRWNQILQNLN